MKKLVLVAVEEVSHFALVLAYTAVVLLAWFGIITLECELRELVYGDPWCGLPMP